MQSSTEANVLRRSLSDLTSCLSNHEQLLSVAMDLYSEGYIADSVKESVIGCSGSDVLQAAAKVLSAVQKYVAVTPGALPGILDVLKKKELCRPVVEKMQQEICTDTHDTTELQKRLLSRQSSSVDSGCGEVETEVYPPMPHTAQSPTQPSPIQLNLHSPMRPGNSHTLPPMLRSLNSYSPLPQHCYQSVSQMPIRPRDASQILQQSRPRSSTDPEATIVKQLLPTRESSTVPDTSLHLECELINGKTNHSIECTQTMHSNISSPVYRDITIKKVRKYGSVPPNTPLYFNLKANKSCYIYIINIGSSGNMIMLVPNEDESNHLLKSGEIFQFPPQEADYEFELDEQSGMETLYLLAYSSKCETQQAEADCLRIREFEATKRDITIKKKIKEPVGALLGYLEAQFVVK